MIIILRFALFIFSSFTLVAIAAPPNMQEAYTHENWLSIKNLELVSVENWCNENRNYFLPPSKSQGRDIADLKDILRDIKSYPMDTNSVFYIYRGEGKRGIMNFLKWRLNRTPTDHSERKYTYTWKSRDIDLNHITEAFDSNIQPIYGHFGDHDQAKNYAHNPYMIRIGLNQNMFNYLFSSKVLALTNSVTHKGKIGCSLAYSPNFSGNDISIWQRAEESQGWLEGYIGIKSEQKGPFSFAVNKSGSSRLLLQMLANSMRIVWRDSGLPFNEHHESAEEAAFREYEEDIPWESKNLYDFK